MDQPPTGQGLRIKVVIENTGPPIEFTNTEFVSYSHNFSELDLDRRVHETLVRMVEEVEEVFQHRISDVVKKVYYPNQVKGAK